MRIMDDHDDDDDDDDMLLDETNFVLNEQMLIEHLFATEQGIQRQKNVKQQIEEKKAELEKCIEKEMQIKRQKDRILQKIQNLQNEL